MQISRRVTAASSGATMDFAFRTDGVAMVSPTASIILMKQTALLSVARTTSSSVRKDRPPTGPSVSNGLNFAMEFVTAPIQPTKKCNAVSFLLVTGNLS